MIFRWISRKSKSTGVALTGLQNIKVMRGKHVLVQRGEPLDRR